VTSCRSGFRGIQVLRPVVVLEQLPRAEPDHVAGQLADRPQQPAAEPVDQATRPALPSQPGGDQLRAGEPVLAQVLGEQIPGVRRETAAVPLCGGPVEASLRQEFTSRPGPGRTELVGIEGSRRGVRRDQPLSLPWRARRYRSAGLVVP